MKQMVCFYTIGTILLISIGILSISGEPIFEKTHIINISSIDEKFSISETLTVSLDGKINQSSFFDVWIPTDASDLKIIFEDHLIQSEQKEDHIYRCNLSTINITSLTVIGVQINYDLPQTTQEFSTMFLRNATQVTIRFNDKSIGTFTMLKNGTILSVPLSIAEEDSMFNVYIIIFAILLLIVIAISVLYVTKKMKISQSRIRSLESEEVLKTEYELLKDMLKQIEKYHRSEKISDDAYHKLKEHYKQQAIETMVALEKTGSKIDG